MLVAVTGAVSTATWMLVVVDVDELLRALPGALDGETRPELLVDSLGADVPTGRRTDQR